MGSSSKTPRKFTKSALFLLAVSIFSGGLFFRVFSAESFTEIKTGEVNTALVTHISDSTVNYDNRSEEAPKGLLGSQCSVNVNPLIRQQDCFYASDKENLQCSQACAKNYPGACNISCRQENAYKYNFDYTVLQDDAWKPVSSSNVNKCEQIRLAFRPEAEWSASLSRTCQPEPMNYSRLGDLGSVATQLLNCADQEDCLAKGRESQLTADTFGKGVQKIPADFDFQTAQSLSSPNPGMNCLSGLCMAYASGNYQLNSVTPASSFFGQCRGHGATIDTPEVQVPAVKSVTEINISNRAPILTVSFDKNQVIASEETEAICDVVDPDECSDKITKVKWTCTDSEGKADHCFFLDQNTGSWNMGADLWEPAATEQSNPVRAKVRFKAGKAGNYAITCEAWDNDHNNPFSGTGINALMIFSAGVTPSAASSNCGSDNFCDSDCSVDPDCQKNLESETGSDQSSKGFCALISDNGGSSNTLCGEKGETKYKAYYSDIDPISYKWKCSAASEISETSTPEVTCLYSLPQSYLPTLTIKGKNGQETECVTETSTVLANESKCWVEARVADTQDEYESQVTIRPQDQVEARIRGNCVLNGIFQWEVPGGTLVNQTKDLARVKFNNTGNTTVKAKFVSSDGNVTECGEAEVNVEGKVQFKL